MSNSNKELRQVEQQLKRLVTCVVEMAERDSEFLTQLTRIFQPSSPIESEPEKIRRLTFNAVEFLHHQGLEALQRELLLRTDTELREILNQEGVKKQKGQKQLNRDDAIQSIVTHAVRRLAQGGSFLQPGL